MRTGSLIRRLAVAGLCCACCGCSSKSPEEVEAERAKANAAWNAQTGAAERQREEDENRLVAQQLAEHERQAQIDAAREQQAELRDDQAEQDRLVDLVRSKYPDPASVKFTNVHWSATKSALCGEVSAPNDKGSYSGFVHFIVNGDAPVIDSEVEDDHARFATAVRSIGCAE
jgi:hypothetical protein